MALGLLGMAVVAAVIAEHPEPFLRVLGPARVTLSKPESKRPDSTGGWRDQHGTPVMFQAALFTIVSTEVPPSWGVNVELGGAREIAPKAGEHTLAGPLDARVLESITELPDPRRGRSLL
jgi:hypothetical protein